MSGLDLAAIREAIASTLEEIDGLYVYRFLPGSALMLPCVIISVPETIDYMVTPRIDQVRYDLTVIIGRMSPEAQERLEGFLSGSGDQSIRSKLFEDQTLGGVVAGLRITGSTTGLYVVPTNSESQLGCDIQLEVKA